MDLGFHFGPETGIHQAVALQRREATEGWTDDARLKVPAVTVNDRFRVRDRRLDKRFDLLWRHGFCPSNASAGNTLSTPQIFAIASMRAGMF